MRSEAQLRVYRNNRGWTWAVIRGESVEASCPMYEEHERWRSAYDEGMKAKRQLPPAYATVKAHAEPFPVPRGILFGRGVFLHSPAEPNPPRRP